MLGMYEKKAMAACIASASIQQRLFCEDCMLEFPVSETQWASIRITRGSQQSCTHRERSPGILLGAHCLLERAARLVVDLVALIGCLLRRGPGSRLQHVLPKVSD